MLAGFVSWFKELPGKVADAIVVPLLVIALIAAAALVAGFLAHTQVKIWVVALAFLAGLLVAAVILRAAPADTESDLEELRRRAEELKPYDTYVEHVRDALGDLRKAIRGELSSFSARDFVEVGVFEPAHQLLTRSGSRGDVRFSILHEDNGDFVMASGTALFPALGHRVESRQKFRLPIGGSFSQLAYQKKRVFWSDCLSEDGRFERHELADPDRAYESIVSVPLRVEEGRVDGVLNVVATSRDAFSPVDRTYISLLGSVVDAAAALAEGPENATPGGVST